MNQGEATNSSRGTIQCSRNATRFLAVATGNDSLDICQENVELTAREWQILNHTINISGGQITSEH